MNRDRHLSVAAGLVLALAIVAGAAVYLISSQRSAGASLRADFVRRAGIAAQLAGGNLASSYDQNRAFAEASLAGPAGKVQADVDVQGAALGGGPLVVLDAHGAVLGATPHILKGAAGRRLVGDQFDVALRTKSIVFGDQLPAQITPGLLLVLPYSTPYGQRVVAMGVPVDMVSVLFGGSLSSSLGTTHGVAYVLDGHDNMLLSTGKEKPGERLSDARLVAAVKRTPFGAVGTSYFGSATVRCSAWRVVFVAQDRALLEPLRSSRRIAWQLFVAFVVSIGCLLALGATALSGSAKLAQARLHDTLTGLPSRALFIDQLQHAISRSKGGSEVAVLFIDLDGFKPINDAYGHAAGDALLVAVAQRLRQAVRRIDVVSRFGGDEFLVLCRGLVDPEEAMTIARRIRDMLAEPFTIAAETITVGSSIGVATNESVEVDGASLIHCADQAMYQAKQAGKGRVVRFRSEVSPTLA